jgi:hypothetical protein
MENYEKLSAQLEEQLLFIIQEAPSLTKQAELSVPVCISAIEQIKKLVQKRPFESQKDEIFFFKHLKPKVSSKLIYHVQVFNIETRKPSGTNKQQKKYFSRQLKNLSRFIEDNLEFYQYYRSDSTFLDEKYFIRGKADLHLILDNNFFNYESTFNTSHDHIVARILANDMIGLYIRNELNKIDRSLFVETKNPVPTSKQLRWTDNKNSLIELIYALQATCSFNDGKADVKEIADYFEKLFDIGLGDLYRNYHELRYRKTNRTKFLDTLKENLTKRMDTIDEK